ncbi:hypothetical protein QX233_06295 [Chryseobacterium gambrini]|uniref:DUF4440 domain-containing protein n=1 Tax=Chryseobacterium gambrini TaxID=373672 RepID=A0AAJ1R1F8_9FLAO|nr:MULTISPECIES: hypothetical protein [Chryseobacterium]MDN4012060.1 hypothetical protein [Chryseobacterium gambrini]QWA37008.1 hypothetical protein KKI44_13795 [Chryseobacterium sp. ZHDP1]
MKLLPFLLCFYCIFGYAQKYSKDEKQLLFQTRKLDSLIQNNDSKVLDLFKDNVSFGHSNGWIQNYSDFKRDFSSKKVIYDKIEQIEISELKKDKNICSLRRKIKVSGTYKSQKFEMILALLEIWKKRNRYGNSGAGKVWK